MCTGIFCTSGGSCATWYVYLIFIPLTPNAIPFLPVSFHPNTLLNAALQAHDPSSTLIGVVVCKLEPHRSGTFRGYIAMLAVQESHRGQGIATKLVCMAIDAMKARHADEIVLETEVTNTASLKLYERLGFLRSKRLHRYYLNGNTAFRLVLYLKEGTASKRADERAMGYGGMENDMMGRGDGIMGDASFNP
jgi:peptide alpha-N-acetyltransferase